MRYPGIESATRSVMKELGVELVDLDGASCCPAPGVFRSFDQMTWLALGARNLALAEEKKANIVTICNGCFGSLSEVEHELHDEKKREEVNKILGDVGMKYNGTVHVKHFVSVLHNEIGLSKISAKVKNKLDFKVGVHYGCHLLRPYKVRQIDDPERPKILDELVEVTGAKSVPYKDKMACCGAGGGVRARTPDVAAKMTEEKLQNMQKAGVQFIVDVCPFCHLQFDLTQKGKEYNIPVLHLTQLYGLAFGVPKNRLGFEFQTIPAKL